MTRKPSHGEGGTGGPYGPGTSHSGRNGSRRSKWEPRQTLNPPFDPRMRRIGSPLVNPKKMKRGWIETYRPMNKGQPAMRINFLFNPSEISLSHAISMNIPTKAQIYESPNLAALDQAGFKASLADIGAGLNFALLFDRTYEVWNKRDNTLANAFGVYADVGAFYKYLGIIDSLPTNPPRHISKPGNLELDAATEFRSWEFLSPTSPPFQVPSFVWIGQYMKYYGYINSFDVTYTHWSHSMVPIRCRVDVGYTLLMDPTLTQNLADGAAWGQTPDPKKKDSAPSHDPSKPGSAQYYPRPTNRTYPP